MGYRFFARILWSLGVCIVGAYSACADPGPQIAGRYNARTARVETLGTMYNGTKEPNSGSGLLVGDHYVLTNSHIIPDEINYQSLQIDVRLKSLGAQPIAVKNYTRDDDNDLALLELATPVQNVGGPDRCPMPVISDPDEAPMGTHIYFLGFPLDRDLTIGDGLVSNQTSEHGQWQTSVLLNAGDSGAPTFNESGALVGLGVGGIISWKFGDKETAVTGVNFIIPATAILMSPLFTEIRALPSPENCWTLWRDVLLSNKNLSKILPSVPEVQARLGLGLTGPSIKLPGFSGYLKSKLGAQKFNDLAEYVSDIPFDAIAAPETFRRDFSVSFTYREPRESRLTQRRRLAADKHYKISGCQWQTLATIGSIETSCVIDESRSAATFTTRAEGPAAGWAGVVSLEETFVRD
jgi:Trypsin-like peptidase domain